MKRFRVVNIIIFLFLLPPIHGCCGQTNKIKRTCEDNNDSVSCHTRVKNHSADRVIWSVHEDYTSVHLYKNELDTTIYPKIDEVEEGRISSYNGSEYASDGLKTVREEFLNTMSLLSEKQLNMMLGEASDRKIVISIKIALSKDIVTKVEFSFFVPIKGILPDSFIIFADKKIRNVKFHNFEKFGIDCSVLHLPILKKHYQSMCKVDLKNE